MLGTVLDFTKGEPVGADVGPKVLDSGVGAPLDACEGDKELAWLDDGLDGSVDGILLST